MKKLAWLLVTAMVAGCSGDELTWLSIHNDTTSPIFALPYSASQTNGDWIDPGSIHEFYSLGCDCLDAFEYFTTYYDSLIINIQDHEVPVKFYVDGTTRNYNPTLNPFTNPEVWRSHEIERSIPGNDIEGDKLKTVYEHYFSFKTDHVKSLADTIIHELEPASQGI